MFCPFCGLGEEHAVVKRGRLTCPHCQTEIVCSMPPDPPSMRCSAEVYELLKKLGRLKQESFWLVTLDARNRIIGKHEVCRGTLVACIVHPRDIFNVAVRKNAAAIVIVHNHPSGDPSPSPEDQDLTTRIEQAGILMGIPLLDHLVIGKNTYFSFRDNGQIRGPAGRML